MTGKDLFQGLNEINRKYIDEAERDMVSNKSGTYAQQQVRKKNFLKPLMIAAIIGSMIFLMGAAVYTRWSGSLQHRYKPTENAKQQAEKSGLSVVYEESKPEDGSVLTATDQGITVSLAQTLVDQSKAQIVLRIEGFEPPVDYKVFPWVWMETPTTLGGDEHFWISAYEEFDDGIIRNEAGEYVYTDGSPVDKIVEGEYEEEFFKGRFLKPDGSMELVLHYDFQDTSGANLGKEMEIHITGFGTDTYKGKAVDEYEKTVDGRWDLRFPLKGSDNNIKIAPNVRLSDNVTLTEAEIGQITIKAWYRTDTYWDGWETLESLTPGLEGVKLKDGTFIQLIPSGEGYLDQENLIYYSEYSTFEGVVDMDQVESLAFYDGWERDADGNPITEIYRYIPIE